ncbi:MAG: hypothetical protein WC595_05880 [Candidatus Nanoarchaeia archaeon]
MDFMYRRKETTDKIIIVYTNILYFYIFLAVALLCSFLLPKELQALNFLITPLFLIFLLIFLVSIWKPNQEIRRAMKKGKVEVSGSKFSFSNPLTFIIKK